MSAIRFAILVFLSELAMVSPALAVQHHGGAEGLVSHQLAHLLFIIGMGYMLTRVCLTKNTGPGWLEFKSFLVLLLLWNLLTFLGHWMMEFVPPHKFISANGRTVAYSLQGPWDFFFYLSRLDHLLLVPALGSLLLALKKWSRFP